MAAQDLEYFDVILAMDHNNFEVLKRICPSDKHDRLGLFMSYSKNFDDDEVPDPYYGLGHGFDLVLDMIEDAASGLLESLEQRLREESEPPVNLAVSPPISTAPPDQRRYVRARSHSAKAFGGSGRA